MGQRVDVIVKGFGDIPLRFNQLVQFINDIERMLGVPYPSPRVTMTRVGNLDGGFCGHNQIGYAPRYHGDAYVISGSTLRLRVDGKCDDTLASIAHEVAHTWFHGNDPADWIDEGLANAIERQVVAIRQPEKIVYPATTYCASYRNIAELERGMPQRVVSGDATGFNCNYELGDGIFGALREHYGDEEFNRYVAALARRSTGAAKRAYTIDDIRESMGRDEVALDIINTWYAGQPEMRKYRHLDAVEWTFPPTIDGEYLHFAGKTREPELVHDFALGDDQYCSQFPLFGGAGGREWVASIADHLPAGWYHHSIPQLVVINHSINPFTGQFKVTARLNDRNLPLDELSLAVQRRVTEGADGLCGESVTYSQRPIVAGSVPVEFKVARHYSLDAIEWISPPIISGNTLRFVGKSLPGAVRLTWREGYCGQFFFYEYDEGGYHYIDNLAALLPANQYWTITPLAEVTSQRVEPDGTFEAIVNLRDNALAGYRNPVLLVKTEAISDRVTNKCSESDVLSAVDIR